MKKEVKFKKNGEKENVELTIKFNKKKVLKGVGIVIIVLAVLGAAWLLSDKGSNSNKTFEFINITIDEYLEKMNSSDKSIIYGARPGCSWCQK